VKKTSTRTRKAKSRVRSLSAKSRKTRIRTIRSKVARAAKIRTPRAPRRGKGVKAITVEVTPPQGGGSVG
jgi:hypothetical protein